MTPVEEMDAIEALWQALAARPVLKRRTSRWRKFPHGLSYNYGDSSLDTPLCHEINQLEAPVAPPDHEYELLLARWFGEGWESR